MHNTYVGLAKSINNLAANQLVRRPNDINNDIIENIQERNVANRSSTDSELMSAYEEKLSDLRKELQLSREFFHNLNERVRRNHNGDLTDM